ncbi:hypothetical protein [Clostridium saccharoperbutylacetonicum]|uniref:hypothetical protein n=1 Tax=Clostridium saccharoperbutylacetonicum TaxID=36745 RepID=UPI000983C9F9|nr:hypothetical protein [Clostridium saccharoperbutylacetonicum]AQR97734.1 hypothetical protein CLSAP_50670 [Clostridium saccharoperbutylacetonicum]NSB33622.1 hypothetical protein [Clostridium saccharoperbutylacetonicum]
MKPYNKNFVFQEMKKYNNLVNPGTCGDYKIVKNTMNKQDLQGYMYENSDDYDIDIIQLYRNNTCLMKLSPREIESSYNAISFSYGKVGIVGLGIGYVVQEIAKKTKVEKVIVYEDNEELIELYYQNFEENEKIKIIRDSALNASREIFDFFYVDSHKDQLTSEVVKDYIDFNKIHEIEEYAFYGLEHFLLSCKYEDIIWVYIPENWVAMSKRAYEALDASRYIETYKPLDEEKVKGILFQFKEILNS